SESGPRWRMESVIARSVGSSTGAVSGPKFRTPAMPHMSGSRVAGHGSRVRLAHASRPTTRESRLLTTHDSPNHAYSPLTTHASCLAPPDSRQFVINPLAWRLVQADRRREAGVRVQFGGVRPAPPHVLEARGALAVGLLGVVRHQLHLGRAF